MFGSGYEPGPADFRIAPPEADGATVIDGVRSLFAGEHPEGTSVTYHSLTLYKVGRVCGPNVWEVHSPGSDTTPIEVVNLDAFRTARSLQDTLDRLLAYDK